jgi:vancomycin aglycone glucosyltransferase
MLVLARGLVRAGHEAVVVGPEDSAGLARELGVRYERLCGPFAEVMPSNQAGMSAVMRAVRGLTAQQLETLPAHARGADLLVGASGLFAGPSVAEALGLPYRAFVLCPRTLPSDFHPSITSPRLSAPRWVNRLQWWANDVALQRIAGGVIAAWRERHGLAPRVRVYRDQLGERPLVAADPLLAPLPPDLVGRAESVGALLLEDAAALPRELEAFLAAGPAPVYLGFGSVTDGAPERTTRLLLDAVAQAGVRAVVSRGWGGLGQGPLPAGVLAVGPTPHAALFPRMAAVVHHGGAGTTHAAARAGVPQVVVPHFFDQYYFASRVHTLGAGAAPLERSRLDAPRLAAALREALQPGVRARARVLRGHLRTDAVQRCVALLTGDARAEVQARAAAA